MPTPKRLGWSGGKHGAQLAGSGVRRGAKLAGPGVRRGVQCGGARLRSKSRCSAAIRQKPAVPPAGEGHIWVATALAAAIVVLACFAIWT